ncbi:MAG: hypothetical protein AB1563_11535 [Bacillota bacterium]
MRRKSQALLMALFMVVSLSAVASAANFNLTIRLEEDTVGFTELGWAAGNKWDVVLGSNYDGNYRQDEGGSSILSTTAFTLGTRYYLKKEHPFDVFLWGNIGFISAKAASDGVEQLTYAKSHRIGLGLAHNVTKNWAVVAVTGYRWITMEHESYRETIGKTFNSLGVRFGW